MVLVAGLGCGTTPPPPPTPPAPCVKREPLNVIFKAGRNLNPDTAGRALPTVVRILQLKNLIDLDKVELQELWDHERSRLAESFLAIHELTLNPGDETILPIDPLPDTRYLAAIALFRQPRADWWRAYVTTPHVTERRCLEPLEHAKKRALIRRSSTPVFLLENFHIRSKS
jgi:type VI secretion system VasD/TssJ family lipoprotein